MCYVVSLCSNLAELSLNNVGLDLVINGKATCELYFFFFECEQVRTRRKGVCT